MKKEYVKPGVEFVDFNVKEVVTAEGEQGEQSIPEGWV